MEGDSLPKTTLESASLEDLIQAHGDDFVIVVNNREDAQWSLAAGAALRPLRRYY